MILTILLFTIVTSCIAFLFARRRSKANEPPIVQYSFPWIGSALQYKKDPIGFLRKCEKNYGPIFTVLMGGNYYTFVVDPFTFPVIAKETKKLNFWAHEAKLTKHAFDVSLDLRTMDQHARVFKNLLVKYFQGEGLNHIVTQMMLNLERAVSDEDYSVHEWKEVGLLDFCFNATFTAGFRTLFTTEQNQLQKEQMKQMVEDFKKFDDIFPFLAQGYPISNFKEAMDARDGFWKIFSSAANSLTYLGHFFSEYQEIRKCYFSLDNISKQFFGLLWASESNTCTSAFWVVYHLLKHADARKAVLAEIKEILNKAKQDGKDYASLTRSDLSQMTVLDSVIKETFRLNLSPSTMRQVVEDCVINATIKDKPYRLCKGDKVVIVYQLTHKDPEIHDEPEKFKYDRFLNEDGSEKIKFYKHGKPTKNNLHPFGIGASMCPGRFWATTALKQIAILVLLRFDMELIHPDEEVQWNSARVAFGALPPTSDPVVRLKLKS